MSQPAVQFRLLGANRQPLAVPDPLKWQYTLTANTPGGFSLTLGYDDLDPLTVQSATRVQAWWRTAPGLPWRWEAEYLVRKPIERRDRDGRHVWTLGGTAAGVLQLLRSRLVQANKGDARSDKLGPVTDLMRAYVRENCTSAAGRDRAFYESLTVQADTGQGPLLSKSAERAYVLDTLQALVKAAAENGALSATVYFDLVPNGDGWLFLVRLGQLEQDRGLTGAAPVVLLADSDLTEWEYEEDAEKEVTVVTVGGKLVNGVQPLVTVSDASRLNTPPGNRWEAWVNQSGEDDPKRLEAEGGKRLDEGARLKRLRGSLRPGLYGDRVRFGRRLVVQRGTLLREAVVDAVVVSGEQGTVKTDIRLES